MTDFIETGIESLNTLVASLRATFDGQKTKDTEFRKNQLRQFWKLVDENEPLLRAALLSDLGKPLVESAGLELSMFKNEVVYMLESLDKWLEPEKVDVPVGFEGFDATIYRQAKGVCLVIGAWNYPFFLAASPFLGVIASGNTGIMKPSELAPATASALALLVPRYLDTTCYAVVNGGVAVTTGLLKLRYDHILYTGGPAVAKIVMQAAAEHLTPVTLELGGKSPVIVSKNADLKLAAKRVAWGKFACAGQTCVAPDYALVEESVLESFVESLKEVTQEFYEGDAKAEHKMGRIVNLRHFERITTLLAKTKGQLVFGGSSDAHELFVEPTVVRDVALDDPLMLEEIFGPILAIVSVPSIAAACALIPRICRNPLGLYVMSEEKSELDFVIANTASGGVSLNDVMTQIAIPNVPFGGVGGSGMGAYHGKASIDTFSHKRSVVHVKREAEEAFGWRYASGDQVEKWRFYKENLEAKL